MTDIQKIREAIKEAKSIMGEYQKMETEYETVPEITWILFLNVFEYFEHLNHCDMRKNHSNSDAWRCSKTLNNSGNMPEYWRADYAITNRGCSGNTT